MEGRALSSVLGMDGGPERIALLYSRYCGTTGWMFDSPIACLGLFPFT
jgi:hypothetical protein